MSTREFLTTKLLAPVLDSTQGRVVFILLYGLCAGSIYAIQSWQTSAAVLTLGYIGVAQLGIGSYFKTPCASRNKSFIVEFCALGYVLIGATSMVYWNDAVSHEVMAGGTVFTLRIVAEYFGKVEQQPTTEAK